MKGCCSPLIRVSARGLCVSHHLMPHQCCSLRDATCCLELQHCSPSLLFCRKRARGHLSPPSPTQAPITGDKNHLLCNSQCLRAEGAWLWYALMVLWESPLGLEEPLPGAPHLEGLDEGHVIYIGLKCTGLT